MRACITERSRANVKSSADLSGSDSGFKVGDDLEAFGFDELVAFASEDSGSSDLSVDLFNNGRRTNQERSSRVSDSFAFGAIHGVSNGIRVDLEFPVSLRGDRGIGEGTSVVVWISTTQNELTTLAWASVHITVKPECKDCLIDEALGHEVVPNWGYMVNGDGVEGKSEDTIKSSSNESDSRFCGDFSKVLSFDHNSTNSDLIVTDEALGSSRTILNGKGSTVGLVGTGVGRIIFGVKITGEFPVGTFGGRNP